MTTGTLTLPRPRMLKKMISVRFAALVPLLISLVCVSLFLLLSYLMIEGFSLSRLLPPEQIIPVIHEAVH